VQWAALALFLALGTGLILSGIGRSQPPEGEAPPKAEPPPWVEAPQRGEEGGNPFHQAIAANAKVDVKTVEAVLKALGPAVKDRLASGQQVKLPGLGTFRVVRVPAHRDLVNGRPAEIPASNYVEFLTEPGLVKASNSPGAVPAATVPKFEYIPIPDRTPSIRTPGRRVPRRRIR
jgi:nucleoid DNA-binding protein